MTKKGKKRNWVPVSVRKPLYHVAEEFVNNGGNPTITNLSQFVDLAIREKLEREGVAASC
ncbi:MAG: hypothetical protein OXK17_00765 [Thaumarchaeota archaeon]|nr:hypothetical protein [Nitrososphaerota archaeon]